MGFLTREKWIPHFKSLKILKSLSHDSVAWMRTSCAERSRTDWDWGLWMAVLEIGVDQKGILMEAFLIPKNHSATQNPSSFWCRTPPLLFWMNHSPLLSGWNKFISFSFRPLAFPCWDFSPGSTTSLHDTGQDTASSPRVAMGMPTLAILCPQGAAQPFLLHPPSISISLPRMVLPEIHLVFFGTRPAQWATKSILSWQEKGRSWEPQLTWPFCFMQLSSEISSKPPQYHSVNPSQRLSFPLAGTHTSWVPRVHWNNHLSHWPIKPGCLVVFPPPSVPPIWFSFGLWLNRKFWGAVS